MKKSFYTDNKILKRFVLEERFILSADRDWRRELEEIQNSNKPDTTIIGEQDRVWDEFFEQLPDANNNKAVIKKAREVGSWIFEDQCLNHGFNQKNNPFIKYLVKISNIPGITRKSYKGLSDFIEENFTINKELLDKLVEKSNDGNTSKWDYLANVFKKHLVKLTNAEQIKQYLVVIFRIICSKLSSEGTSTMSSIKNDIDNLIFTDTGESTEKLKSVVTIKQAAGIKIEKDNDSKTNKSSKWEKALNTDEQKYFKIVQSYKSNLKYTSKELRGLLKIICGKFAEEFSSDSDWELTSASVEINKWLSGFQEWYWNNKDDVSDAFGSFTTGNEPSASIKGSTVYNDIIKPALDNSDYLHLAIISRILADVYNSSK